VVTHGTDTIIQTARALAGIPNKTLAPTPNACSLKPIRSSHSILRWICFMAPKMH
jgi:hypothetical protein